MENVGQLEATDKRQTAYFANLALRYKSAFRPHYLQGETLGKGPEVWQNVSEHCLVAGAYAEILADELHLTAEEKKTVVQAAILHDWYKKHEVIAQLEANKKGVLNLQELVEIRRKEEQFLREMGISEEIISLTGANVPETAEGPQDQLGKIIWYVDIMLTNTEAVPVSQRIDQAVRGWDGQKYDSEKSRRSIVISDAYREKYQGKSLYDVQTELGKKIGAEFAEELGYQGEVDLLPLFLQEKLRTRIENFKS